MDVFLHQLSLALPLFSLVLIGYLTMRLSRWPTSVSDGLTRFVFTLALPAMLFRLMSQSRNLPPVDSRLLIAFFGGCLIVFVIGRLVSWKFFALDGVSQSIFALGGVFSNNVMLGLPLAKVSLGEAAVPSVALVLVFNALILWTLVTVSVEWARHGNFSLRGFARTAKGVLTNPVVVGLDVGCDGAAAPRTSICTQGSSAVAASRARLRLSEVGGIWRNQWANVPSEWKFHSVGACSR